MQRVLIFDTTLRDGEQSPGASMTPAEKLRFAHQLDALGVDIIEAGFPISSPADHTAVQQIARDVRRPVIAGLARAARSDVEDAARSLESAERARIHVFLATSDIHLRHKLRMSRAECLDRIASAVEHAREYVDDVEFSAEDATRSDPGFLVEVVAAAYAAGARTINLPDTVGYMQPKEYGEMFALVRASVAMDESVVWSAHCHDDLGLAVANSLAAIEAGVRQVECTVNGIGERAGNAALEEIVMGLHTRKDVLPYTTGINTREIYRSSHLLSHLTGVYPQPNKAIVGRNAFAHEAGIHQDGMIKERTTYEIMEPETVGVRETNLILGKHSGRNALSLRFAQLGFEPDEVELERTYVLFKLLAAQKKEILDEDLISILHHGALEAAPHHYRLRGLEVVCGSAPAHARVRINMGGEECEATATGDGPIAATFAAINTLVERRVELEDLTIHAVTPGVDAIGEVSVRARIDGRTFTGRGASPDIVNGAARAYLQALDKSEAARELEASAHERSSLWGV
jgi:2-isopropylmalate synthase